MRRPAKPAKSVVLASAVIAACALFCSGEAGALAAAGAAPAASTSTPASAHVLADGTPTPPPAAPNAGNDPWD